MRSNYKPIGNYIQKVEHRNRDLKVTRLLGLSMTKEFRETTSNIVGTDMSVYRVMSKYQFACDFMSPIRVNKLPVVLKLDDEPNLVSPAYPVFEIKDKNELDPEYLMMWFRRPEFDRYATFKCDAAIRGGYEWTELCETLIPVPSINKQREIVKEYNTIQNRINLNTQLIQKLEETAQAIYKEWFLEGVDMGNLPEGWSIKKLSDFCDIKGGKRLPKGEELNDENNGNPYIKVTDMTKEKFIVLNDSFQFVSNEIQKSISRYIVQTGDIIISIVGTIGLVNIVDSSLEQSNLTENCYRLTNFKVVHSDYLYYYLISPLGKKEIESRTVGGVQAKLPMYNVQSLPIVLPKKDLLVKFERLLYPINDLQNTLTKENHKLIKLKELLLSKLATVKI